MKTFGIILAFLLALVLPAGALDIISATITVTNTTGPTNGQTLTVNSSVRIWTNTVWTPATQILRSTSIGGAATNLFFQIAANGYTPQLALSMSGTNGVNLQTAPGGALSVSLSPGWGTVTLATNTFSPGTIVRVPYTIEGAPQQTNVVSGIIAMINAPQTTNQVASNAPAMVQFVSKGGQNNFTGSNFFSNLNASNAALVNPYLTNGQNFGNALSSHGNSIGAEQFGASSIADGLFGLAVGAGALSSNISATAVGSLSHAFATTATALGTASAALQYGATAAGTGASASGSNSTAIGALSVAKDLGSTSLGNSATATNSYSLAAGYLSFAGGLFSAAIGAGAEASNYFSFAIGPNSVASASNATAFGSQTFASHANSTVVGYGASSTRAGQVLIGNSSLSPDIVVDGNLNVTGSASNITAASQWNFPSRSDVAFSRYAITSLANGDNADIDVGTNVFIELSGPTAAFTVHGFKSDALREGKLLIVIQRTSHAMTIANESGVEATASRRILTLTGNPWSPSGNCAALFAYNSGAARWILLSSSVDSAVGNIGSIVNLWKQDASTGGETNGLSPVKINGDFIISGSPGSSEFTAAGLVNLHSSDFLLDSSGLTFGTGTWGGQPFFTGGTGFLTVPGLTNTGLTASSLVVADANKKTIGLANGGNNTVLHGTTPPAYSAVDVSSADITGVLKASAFPALTGDITTSVGALSTTLKNTGTAGTYRSTTFDAQGRETAGSNPTTFSGYAISDTSANLATALTDETGTGVAVFSDSPVFTTKITSPQWVATTNLGTTGPNFALSATDIQTNAAFTVLAPVGVDQTKFETTVMVITNSTAAAVLITAPANAHTQGTWYVTNVTEITFSHYGKLWTNAIAFPLW